MDEFLKLLKELQRITDIAAERQREARRRGEAFNVFNVLGLSTSETRTHSAFLAELLNPNGSHGCGAKFLREFLKMDCLKGLPFDVDAAKVKTEHFIGPLNEDTSEGGRLDIILKTDKVIIVIENKINAKDQGNQLERYRRYLDKQTKQGKLLYLTLDGHEYSNKRLDYSPISYGKEILKWLVSCAHLSIQKPLVRETIIQYINLIKQLTNQTMDYTDKEAIIKMMAEYPDAVAQMFHVGHTEYTKYVFNHKVRKGFLDFAKENGLVYKEKDIFNEGAGKGFFFHLPEWKASAIYIWTDKKKHETFYCGISHYKEAAYFREHIKGIGQLSTLPESPDTYWPLGYKSLDRYQDWSSYTVRDMVKGRYNEYIEELVLNVLNELKQKNILLP